MRNEIIICYDTWHMRGTDTELVLWARGVALARYGMDPLYWRARIDDSAWLVIFTRK